jgi:ABC-type amino acid transport substrate-binding protein
VPQWERAPAAVIVLTLLLGAASPSAGVLDDVRARGELRVATTFDYRPFSYRADSRAAGIDIELARALAARLGVTPLWVETSWPALLADLEAGRFDIAMSGVSVTTERLSRGLMSRPYFHTGKSVLARCTVAHRFRTLADIDRPDVRVIVNPGGTNEAFVARNLRRARIVRHPDNAGIFAALEGGAADLMITDGIEADIESGRHTGLCHARQSPWLEAIDKAWLLPRDAAWKAWLDAWLATLEADGSLTRVIERYSVRPAEPVAQ